VFDFDGVIADDEPLHLAAFQRTLAAEGITLSAEAYYARYLVRRPRRDRRGVP